MNRNFAIVLIVLGALFLYGALISVMVKNSTHNVVMLVVAIVAAIAFTITSIACSENLQ